MQLRALKKWDQQALVLIMLYMNQGPYSNPDMDIHVKNSAKNTTVKSVLSKSWTPVFFSPNWELHIKFEHDSSHVMFLS